MHLDTLDREILKNRLNARAQITRPRCGDFVRFPNGKVERISNRLLSGAQTSPVRAGSFYLCAGGDASFSGGLNPPVPLGSLTHSSDSLPGSFWFFHHDAPGKDRGVWAEVPCRVYDTTAEYQGFLTYCD